MRPTLLTLWASEPEVVSVDLELCGDRYRATARRGATERSVFRATAADAVDAVRGAIRELGSWSEWSALAARALHALYPTGWDRGARRRGARA